MPQHWDAKNKMQPEIVSTIFYETGQHFTNSLHMVGLHSVNRSTVAFTYITAVANNSNLPATTENTVIRNNSKPAKLVSPIHSCQRIDIPSDIERD